MTNSKYILGIFDSLKVLNSGIDKVQESGIKIYDVYTPFPIHGLEHKLSVPRSRIPIAGFCFGLLGFCTAISLITYTMGIDWPMDIGGKPYLPFPNYVPVTFELTVLFAALGMAATFFWVNRMAPGISPVIMDPRSTDDKFVVAIANNQNKTEEEVNQILRDAGAVEIKIKEV